MVNEMEGESMPLACVMEAIPAGERPAHLALVAQLFGEAVEERQDLRDGYAFRFAATDFAAVARFVENERKCCPFLSFELQAAPAGGPLWLRMSGPPGTRELLAAELPI